MYLCLFIVSILNGIVLKVIIRGVFHCSCHVHRRSQLLPSLVFFGEDFIQVSIGRGLELVGGGLVVTGALVVCHAKCFDESFVVDKEFVLDGSEAL